MTQEQFLKNLPPNLFDKGHTEIWLNRFGERFVEDILFDYILDEFKNLYFIIANEVNNNRNERVISLYKSWEREQKLNQLLNDR